MSVVFDFLPSCIPLPLRVGLNQRFCVSLDCWRLCGLAMAYLNVLFFSAS